MEYQVIYAKRRSVSIRVTKDLKIEVRAPKGLSRDIIDGIVRKHAGWIEKRLEKIQSQPNVLYNPTTEEINILKEKTRDIVLPIVEKYAKIMGLEPAKVTITSAKQVFGSYTSKKHLNFSFRLALYPYDATEYVVVHELCHMREMNHSKKFWSLVETYLPDYKKRRRLLK